MKMPQGKNVGREEKRGELWEVAPRRKGKRFSEWKRASLLPGRAEVGAYVLGDWYRY
jgi:hypothetical protein